MASTVLISGASVAGPALAYWLRRYGFEPVVVEHAPAVRSSGYPIDIRGVAVDVVDRAGVLPRLRAAHVDTQRVTFVDAHGRPTVRVPQDAMTGSPAGRDIEVPRGKLASTLYEATRDDVEYVFDDSITTIAQGDDGVHVTFRRGRPRTVDLVVGADGLHSNVRRLAFGPEKGFRHDLGFYFAGFTMDDGRGLDRELLAHNTPGRLAGWYAVGGQDRSTAMLAFASPELGFDHTDVDAQRELVARAFEGSGWEVPRLLAGMREADDFFFDSVSQIRMPHWTDGRVALVGDAGYAPALLSGQGTSLALVGAYVLAGELAAAHGDHRVAFPAYEGALRGFVESNQAVARAGGAALIPRTWPRIRLRNLVLSALPRLGPVRHLFTARMQRATRGLTLRDYQGPPTGDKAATSADGSTAAPSPGR